MAAVHVLQLAPHTAVQSLTPTHRPQVNCHLTAPHRVVAIPSRLGSCKHTQPIIPLTEQRALSDLRRRLPSLARHPLCRRQPRTPTIDCSQALSLSPQCMQASSRCLRLALCGRSVCSAINQTTGACSAYTYTVTLKPIRAQSIPASTLAPDGMSLSLRCQCRRVPRSA